MKNIIENSFISKKLRNTKKNATGISVAVVVSMMLGMSPDTSFAALDDMVDSYSEMFMQISNEMTPQDGVATAEQGVQTREDGVQTGEDGVQTGEDGVQTGEDGTQSEENGNPTKPEEPTDPVEPEDPTKPEEPTDPVEPEEPTEPTKPEDPTEPEVTIKFTAQCPDYIVDLSSTTTINPSIRNANKKYTIKGGSSSNTKVAKVASNGKVTLVGAGDALITLNLLSEDDESFALKFYITATGKLVSSGTSVTTKETTTKETTKKAITKATFKLAYSSVAFGATKRTPTVTVKYGNITLKKNTDYTVTYSSNINAGKAVVTVKGKGNYTGQKKLYFTIKPVSLAKAKVTFSQLSYAYNGKNHKPGIKQIKLGTKNLGKSDYTVTYSKNTKTPGVKNILIKGKGNYTGTIRKTYVIKPAKVAKISKSQTTKTTTIKWSKVNGATGYEVYKFSPVGSKYVKVATVKTVTYTDKKLTTGTKYYYKVRAYIKSGNKTIYGAFSENEQVITKPVRVTTQFKIKGNDLTVLWKKIPGATGYEVYMSTGKGYSKVADTKRLKFIKNNLKRNIKYSFRVRSYVKDSKGKKVYSDYGATKSIKL